MNKNDIIKARASGHQAKLIIKEINKDAVVQELKRQLAEKDKEIEKLKHSTDFDVLVSMENAIKKLEKENKELINGAKQMLYEGKEVMQSIRHQLCEKIKEKLKVYRNYTDEENIGWYIEEENINKILDQIEQGEKK